MAKKPQKPQTRTYRHPVSKTRVKRSNLNAIQRKMREDGLCGAKRKDKRKITKDNPDPTMYCKKPAGHGTEHVGYGTCKLHGGSMPNQIKGAEMERAMDEAIVAVETYGLPRQIDPHSALIEELSRTAGHVAWLSGVIQELEESQIVGPVGTEGTTEEGLIHHAKGEPNVWVTLYQAERKHLTDVAATCIKAGIEERRVRIAEQQGQLLAGAIKGILEALGIDPSSDKARKVVRDQLTTLTVEGREIEEIPPPSRNGAGVAT